MIQKKFIELNKNYYRYIEDYDWVKVTDNFKGLESLFHKFREKKIRKIIEKYGRGKSYLDAGCGTGLILRHLPKDSIGIDINPRNIMKAKKHAPHAKIVKADIEKLPFKKETFSTIICTEVIEHQPNAKPTIKELKRVLKKDGVFIGTVPAVSLIWSFRFLSSTCPQGEPFHKNYNKNELKELFKDFKIIQLEKIIFGMSYLFVLEKYID